MYSFSESIQMCDLFSNRPFGPFFIYEDCIAWIEDYYTSKGNKLRYNIQSALKEYIQL